MQQRVMAVEAAQEPTNLQPRTVEQAVGLSRCVVLLRQIRNHCRRLSFVGLGTDAVAFDVAQPHGSRAEFKSNATLLPQQ
jgi:hypothetical protein